MPCCQTYLPTLCFSCFGLDPETPAADYQIHFVRTQDAAYIPPDSEAWPLFYASPVGAMQTLEGPQDLIPEGEQRQGGRQGRQDRH